MNQLTIKPLFFVIIIILLAAGSVFAIDLYVPSLPEIKHSLSTTRSLVQYTIIIYLIGFSLSQLIYGPLSEVFGRKKTLLSGLLIAVIGSLFCFLANSITSLLLARLLQGIGCGALPSLMRAMLRDCYVGEEMAKFSSYVGVGTSIAPVLAPIVGGYVSYYSHWRMNFLLMLVFFAFLLFIAWQYLPETIRNKKPFHIKQMLLNYYELIRHRHFIACCIISSASFSSILIYYIMSPFILQKEMGLTAVAFGWLAIFFMGANFISKSLNVFLLSSFSSLQVLSIGIILTTFASFLLLILTLFELQQPWVIVLPMTIIMLGNGLIFGNVMTAAFTPFGHIAGSAGALYGSMQIFGTIICGLIAAIIKFDQQLFLALILLALSFISLVSRRYVQPYTS